MKALLSILAGVAVSASVTAGSLPAHAHATTTDNNWAGYIATGSPTTFKSVSTSWIQPGVTCTSKAETDSSFWVGLGGWSKQSQTIEQEGTEADCIKDKPVYYGWYEMWPANTQYFGGTVKPGDHITATTVYDGSNKFTLTLSDSTQGWKVNTTKTQKNAIRDSAEVIVEADGTEYSGNLADYGNVTFSSAAVNGQNLGTQKLTKANMVDGSKTVVSVSPITNGKDFSATYK
jgi:peptidase A4-like protein